MQTLASPKKTQQLNRDEPVAQISDCIMAGLDRKRGADFIAMLQEIGGKVRARSMCCVCVCVCVYSLSLASRDLLCSWYVCASAFAILASRGWPPYSSMFAAHTCVGPMALPCRFPPSPSRPSNPPHEQRRKEIVREISCGILRLCFLSILAIGH